MGALALDLLSPMAVVGAHVMGAARLGRPPFPKDGRVRGSALQRIREQHFRKHPLCVRCLAKKPPAYALAVVLDHIVALANGGKDFDEDQGSNRQGLCLACHVEKTREDMGYRTDKPLARRVGPDGFYLEQDDGDGR